jgi:uncharacterized protein YcbK (DUF882 family)
MWKSLGIAVICSSLVLPVSPAVSQLLPETEQALKKAEALYGQMIFVTSAFRTPEWNAQVGGVPGSYHLSGEAIDIRMPASSTQLAKLIWALCHSGFHGIGVYGDHVHADIRKKETFWRG